MARDTLPSDGSVQSLLDELVAALSLRAWVDEPEDRRELRGEIIRRVRAGESTPAPVGALLDHADWAVRQDAAEMLGWIGDWDTAKPLLARLWTDRSAAVRGAIAMALGRIGSPEADAASKEYERAIRYYPEVSGRVSALPGPGIFDAALGSLAAGISIADTVETGQGKLLAFDLADLLDVLGERGRSARWCCRKVECVGEYSDELHGIDEQGLIVLGRTLAHIALMIDQTIEGTFVALDEDDRPWLIIQAVDSSCFDVLAGDAGLLERFRERFKQVTEIG